MGRSLKVGLAAASLSLAWQQAALAQQCDRIEVYLQVAPNHAEDVMEYIAPRLKEKTGADLVVETMGVTDSLSRLKAQQPNPRVTVVHLDGGTGQLACEEGFCSPIDTGRIEGFDELLDWAVARKSGDDIELMTHSVAHIGFLYNVEEFRKQGLTVPDSWEALVSSDLFARLGLTAPQSTYGTAGLVQLSTVFGGDESNVEPGLHKVKEMVRKGATVYTWTSEMSNLMQLGSIAMAVTGSSVAPSLNEKGLTVDFVWPADGSPAVENTVLLAKGSPCHDVAAEYFNIYFSDEFLAKRMRSGGGLTPSDNAVGLLSKEEADTLYLKPEDTSRLVRVDWLEIFKHRDGWIEQWKREIR